ncbi:16S rRNA (cytidine(1402)-2'-O)-methyltransferase [candidate division KSB3 bacterium]|uniref:Ribosomal RNA small subunit methyltransferase I n=1 Tax=candidate division KSB3 bacterium TaxID=2044937 RepID=A0A9D5Q4A2_9BACT|nr:16S rRNA (cytidine(1402)-2'-O)-methyltransferase [candidate division KSB3 bacterium]MBD3323340.1 16S rRNA (cytidine(1402)-2'-O)-methyltransferase [candidate division KSB3 bacterium]
MKTPGTLYIVSTPIGNLEDITLRALRILREVDLIAAEDTRHTRKLLAAYDIHTPLTSYFAFNEARKSVSLMQRLSAGESVALVSDAGTPGLADPGYELIQAAIDQDLPVVPVPGPSAAITALTVSGLPCEHFTFIGFLTNKRTVRIKKLKTLQTIEHTIVCYASPHHILKTLEDIQDILGNRRIVVARELTKRFEEIVRGEVETVRRWFQEKPAIKGEFTLVIAGAETADPVDAATIRFELQRCMTEQGMSRKDAVKYVVHHLKVAKNRVYQESLHL